MVDPLSVIGALGGLASIAGVGYSIYTSEQAQEDAKKAAKKFAEDTKKNANNPTAVQAAIDSYLGQLNTIAGAVFGQAQKQAAAVEATEKKTNWTLLAVAGAIVGLILWFAVFRK